MISIKRSTIWMLVTGLATGGIVGYFSSSSLDMIPEPRTDSGVARLQDESSQAVSSTTRTDVPSPSVVDQEPLAEVNGSDGNVVPQPPPMSFLRPELLRSSRFKQLTEMFHSEPVDEFWGPDLESRLYNDIGRLNLTLLGLNVHCRTTMCRMELIVDTAHQNEEAYYKRIYDEILAPLISERGRISAASGIDASPQPTAMHDDAAGYRDGEDAVRVSIAYLYRRELLPTTPERDIARRAVEQYRRLDRLGELDGEPISIEFDDGVVTVISPVSQESGLNELN